MTPVVVFLLLAVFGQTSGLKMVNIAGSGKATQSSTHSHGEPERAIDGSHASNWGQRSCTHTNREERPWWRLEFQQPFNVDTVTITNRKDCCSERLNGAQIRIGNSLDDNGNANPICASIKNIGPGSSDTFQCKGMVGRYINIVIPGRSDALTLCEVEVTGQPAPVVNIARSGKVTQSSTHSHGEPQRAIDGSHASNWGQRSCTHTNGEKRPWWRLELQQPYNVDTVTITNRKDCCSERLNGAQIRIGNSLDDNGNANPICASIKNIGPGSSDTFQCKGMVGRYINIVIPGRSDALTLCEVEVTGQPAPVVNIARSGKVTQSSTHSHGEPERAIDGSHASNWGQRSCTHTNGEERPWWRLELQQPYNVDTVTITNRKDCCSERLNGAQIRIGNSLDDNGNANPICASIKNIGPGSSDTFQCKGMVGRYINIVIPGRSDALTLCEVEVTGQPAPVVNIARSGKVTQSSTHSHGEPERAIDGSHASNWGQRSCTHTNREERPWWRLELQQPYNVDTVTITNRKDCCSERLNGAQIRIGNSLDDNGNANPICASIKNIGPGSSDTFQCKGMVGRYINIVIPGRSDALTLCEVEVTGQPAPAVNIARSGKVTQSSMHSHGEPERAIDGSHASNWGQRSCTHTNGEERPWWRLELQQPYNVDTVTITNRKDCCSERLNGAQIRIGNSLDDNGNANPICASIKNIGPGSSDTFQCKGMVGRYINIVIPGRSDALTLCEVEVTGQPAPVVNIARSGKVTQSSTHSHGEPERAIDGSHASNWGQRSCTHTNREERPWWRLELQQPYNVDTVTITNRKDCCSERLNGAQIRIGNSLDDNGNANPICASIKNIGPGSSDTFQCKGMVGRYINIVIPGRSDALTLCEVEVTGQPAPAVNIARSGKVTQSSTHSHGEPERAIDGSHASNWGQRSCTHTNGEERPWWRLELQQPYNVDTVTITNRKDCCSERLNGAQIRIGNSLDDNGNANPICASIKNIGPGSSDTFQCKGMVGRYINIVIPGRSDALTLCEVEVTGQPAPVVNIARSGKVTQSSTHSHGEPERAIDGSHASNWGQRSCTHTNGEKRPWWRLELQQPYNVDTVTITNRKDCCSERLNGAQIRIGNSLDDNGNANPICASIKNIGPGSSDTFQCKGMVGRYINIVIPGRSDALTLCEVEVTGQPAPAVNIARSGKVTQSSTHSHGEPERAIDGSHASNWGQRSCTHTNREERPWWRLELQQPYNVDTVTITNRKDCCSERLNGAQIRIGNSLDDNGNANPICASIKNIGPGSSDTFQCKGMVGRYINIVIPGRSDALTLCEVEVTGQPAPVVNIARSGKVTQSSTHSHGEPERAIDGSHASNWGQRSCTHTNGEKRPWWRLELQQPYNVDTVTITNRKDCCSERLNGAQIRIGNSLDDNGNANPICASIKNIGPGSSDTFQCKGMVGRYINIVIPGRSDALTLCEVEVTGQPAPVVNIARSGKVTQSSTHSHGEPERAIDGSHASNWGQRSCTHTNGEKRPWWRLELQQPYNVDTVTITNRKDCCSERLNGAQIRIGNSLDDNGNANPICASIKNIGPGSSDTFQCKGMVGRYINIVIPGRSDALTLCEVGVTGQPAPVVNIARSGKVTQSSTHSHGEPERAIDGSHASNWGQRSCTHTNREERPWWRLELQQPYNVDTVTITNRKDCCSERLNGAEIRIGNSLDDNGNANPKCTRISSIPAGEMKTFQCNGMKGRYVNIVIPNREESLTLCEVEVTGVETVDDDDEDEGDSGCI